MNKICYYVSDHGWGHAARSIAVIRDLLTRDPNIEVIVKVDYALEFMRKSLPSERVNFERYHNDFGFFLKEGSLQVDRERTRRAIPQWLSEWNRFIENEKRYCAENDVTLIVSDIAPQPFVVARSLGIPGVAISNFTWHGIYENLFGETEEVSAIREAYEQADLVLVLPMAEPKLPFKCQTEIGLVVRRPVQERREVRAKLSVSPDACMIYTGLGMIRSSSPTVPKVLETARRDLSDTNQDVIFLIPAHLSCDGHQAQVRVIPDNDTESQNYIAACDLVISKAGYSTVAEAIAGRVPMLLIERDEISEDNSTLQAIEALDIGRGISEEALLNGEFTEVIASWLSERYRPKAAYNRLPERYRRDGSREAANRILELMDKERK
jgi:uncharacterized protein (TIGR00661 family)